MFWRNMFKLDSNFRKTISPFFSDKKCENGNHIALSDNNDIINDQLRVAEIFNDYFSTVTMSISFDDCVKSASEAINKHSSRPSVLKIQGNRNPEQCFSFHLVDTQQVSLALKRIPPPPPKGEGIWQFSWKDNPHCVLETIVTSYTFDKCINIHKIFSLYNEARWNYSSFKDDNSVSG